MASGSYPLHTGGEDAPSCRLGTTAKWDSLEPGFLSRAHNAACSRPVYKEHSTQLHYQTIYTLLKKQQTTAKRA